MTQAEEQEYKAINDMFYRYFGRFNQDFDLAMSCLTSKQVRLDYAYNQGWDSRRFDDSYMWSPKNIIKYAVLFSRAMHQRKKFLYNLSQKVDIVKELAIRNPVKTIMFSESTEFADKVQQALGPIALTYHSYIKPETEQYVKVTKYKTKPDKKEYKSRKIGRKRLLARAIERFKDNRYKARFLATAKALDEGLDVPDIECAIVASYTSNPTQQIQRRGRAVRKWTFKDGTEKRPIIIYLYTEGTQEEVWLKKSLKHTGIKYIESVDEIFEQKVQLFSSPDYNVAGGSSPNTD
jgi:superfamily II DNA or RNA helicase